MMPDQAPEGSADGLGSPGEDFTVPLQLAQVIAFDFEQKVCPSVSVDDIGREMARGRYLWIDVYARDEAAAKELIRSLDLVGEPTLDELFSKDPASQLLRFEEYLHLVLATCRLEQDGALRLERVDSVVGEGFLLTVHEHRSPLIDGLMRDYRNDFIRFAQSPSFLIYELWDHLADHYISVQKRLEHRVQAIQVALLRHIDDAVFEQVSGIGVALLHFRSVLVPARAVLAELATRKTAFVSEATRVFLANMVGTLERVLQDLLVDRDSLNQSLNLAMSMIAHRTGRAMNKLAVLSTIFLPLTFLCGVYGMNFVVFPEVAWEGGYVFFWCLVVAIVGAAVVLIKRSGMF